MPFRKLLALLFLSIFLIPISKAHAAATPSATISATPSAVVRTQAFDTDSLLVNLVHTFSCITEGIPIDGKPCFQNLDPIVSPIKKTGFLPEETRTVGAIGLAQSISMSLFFNAPIRTTEYLGDVGDSLNPVRSAHAQVNGTGGRVIEPILQIWKLTRNIAYLAMTVIFILIGFMIMLQRRVNPQTVISIQNALPGLIVGLVLITFSYFFSALIIDTSFLAANLVGNVLETTNVDPKSPNRSLLPPGTTRRVLEEENVISIFNSFITASDRARIPLENAARDTLTFLDRGFVQALVNTALFTVGCSYSYEGAVRLAPTGIAVLSNSVGTIPAVVVGAAACAAGGATLIVAKWFIVGVVLYLVLVIMLFVAMFKLTLGLISSYISIIVLTVTAPFYFLMSSIPGRGNLAGEWVKSMFAHVLAFPAVYIVFIFAAYIGSTNPGPSIPVVTGFPVLNYVIGANGGEISETFKGITPAGTFDSSFAMPLFSGLPADLIRLLLAYGILLGSAAVPDALRQAFGVKGMGAFAQTAAGNIGLASALGPRAGKIGYSRLWKGAVDKDGNSISGREGPLQQAWRRIPRLGRPRRD